MAKRDILPLTGLRGVAALWVAAYHLVLPAGLVGGVAARALGRGYLAVDLFFVLSGFVMALTYGDQFTVMRPFRAWPGFVWRRWARIFPLYGVLLIGRLLYTQARYGTFDLPRPWIAVPLAHPWSAIPANLLLVQAWGLAPSVIGPAWSISTEFAAYLLLPLLAIAILHRGWRVCLAAVAFGLGAVVAASALNGSLDCWDSRSLIPLIRCLGGFYLGMAAWRLSRWAPAARLAGRRWCGRLVWAALALALAAGAPDLAIYPLLPTLILCLASGRSGWLGGGVAVWLGEISYALYLLHIFLLHPFDQARAAAALVLPAPACDLAAFAAIFTLLIAASDLAHRCVERPLRAHLTDKSFLVLFFKKGLLPSLPSAAHAARTPYTHLAGHGP